MPYYAPFYQTPNNYTPNLQNGFIGQNNGFYGYSNQQGNLQNQQNTDMIWVLNKNEADAYPVAPNCTVTLWDKSEPVIYLKSMSSNGIPSMRIIDYTERTEMPLKSSATADNTKGINYVTQDEITAINGKIDDLTARCDVLEKMRAEKEENSTANTTKNDKKSKGSDE